MLARPLLAPHRPLPTAFRAVAAVAPLLWCLFPATRADALGFPACVSYWYVSYSGNSSYTLLNTDVEALPLEQLQFSRGYSDPTDLSKGYLDFDRDRKSDVFSAVPIGGGEYQWRFSSGGATPWIDLAYDDTPPDQLRFGDFDGDGHTDVFSVTQTAPNRFQWRYSPGGASSYRETIDHGGPATQPLPYDNVTIDLLRFGDFNGDGRTDVFRLIDLGNGSFGWNVFYSGTTATNYTQINSATTPLTEMQFGDIDHNGHTDVFTTLPGAVAGTFDWVVSGDGAGTYQHLTTRPQSVHDLRLAGNFNPASPPGFGGSDFFYTLPRQDGTNQWWFNYYSNDLLSTGDTPLAYDATPPDQLRFADFDGDGVTDVFKLNRVCTRSDKSKCDAGKAQCVAKQQACLLAAHVKAEKKGQPLDAVAVAKCRAAFDGGAKGSAQGCVGKLEAKEDPQKPETSCTVKNDVTALEDRVDDYLDFAVSAVDPGAPALSPDDCNAGKKSCLAKRARCLFNAQISAAKKGVPADPAAIQKCNDAFDGGAKGPAAGCIGKLEAKQKAGKPKTLCAVTSNVAALETLGDAFVADEMRMIRLPPP